MEHLVEDGPLNGYIPDGKGGYKKINDYGMDQVDYLYDSEGNIVDMKMVEISNGQYPNRTYGSMKLGLANRGLYDPSFDIAVSFLGGGGVKTGLTWVSKAANGLKVGFGGSKLALQSTVMWHRTIGSASFSARIPTMYLTKGMKFTRATNWSTLLGRYTAPVGGAILGTQLYRLKNYISN